MVRWYPFRLLVLIIFFHHSDLNRKFILICLLFVIIVEITKTVLTGDAAITRNRGKTKHVYDFTATCDWKLTVMEASGSPEVIKGTIIMNDITGDKDYEFDVTVDSSSQKPSADAQNLIKSHVKAGSLQQKMIIACNTFYDDFKAK